MGNSVRTELQTQTTAARVVAAIGTRFLGIPALEHNPKERLAQTCRAVMTGTKRSEIIRHYALEFIAIERIAMYRKYSCHFVAVGQSGYNFHGLDVVGHTRIGQIVQHGSLVDHIAAKEYAIVFVEQPDTSP